MTLRPIPGAPVDAPIPDFPTGTPTSPVAPETQLAHRTVEPLPTAVAPSSLSPTRPPGPVEIRGDGDSVLTFRVIPEVPAINRSSMTISVAGEPTADDRLRTIPSLDLVTDEARALLQALRDATSPVVVGDSRSGFQIEFVVADDGPIFTVSKAGEEPVTRRFKAGCSDVKAMAVHLLAVLGP